MLIEVRILGISCGSTLNHSKEHISPFSPPKLVEPFVKSSCPKGGLVFDPFVGSGTTCVVAWKLGRNFIGCDINPEYIEIAEGRLSKLPNRRLDRFA